MRSHPSTRSRARVLTAALLASVCGSAAASDFFASAGFALSRYDVVCGVAGPCDKSATGWRLAGGWQIDPTWSAELVYLSAGTFKAAGSTVAGDADVWGVGLAGGYRLPIAAATGVVLRLGVARTEGEFTPTSGATSGAARSRSATAPLLGAGLVHDMSASFSARLDWDYTRARMANDLGSVHLLTASAQLRF